MNELEAKYLVVAGLKPKRALRRVLAKLMSIGYEVKPSGRGLVRDSYVETCDWRLYRARWSLRLRERKDRHTLTLKRIGSSSSGLFSRTEIEQPVESGGFENSPNWCLPRIGPVADELRSVLGTGAKVRRLFALSNRRTRHTLHHARFPGSAIELTMDEVALEGPKGKQPLRFVELEFELQRGDRHMLDALDAELETFADLYRSRLSKFQRGLYSSGASPPNDGHLLVPIRDRRCRWADLALIHLQMQLRPLKRWEPMAWEGIHPEGIHQMRVTTRRIRAALRAFANVLPVAETESLSATVGTLGKKLGAVRDMDVQLKHLALRRRQLSKNESKALKSYGQHLQRGRKQAHKALRDALENNEYQELLAAYSRLLLNAPAFDGRDQTMRIEQAAHQLVLPMLNRLIRSGTKIKEKSAPEKLHKLRIQVKRARYLLEYLAEPYNGVFDDTADRLGELQDILGNHQDAYVAMENVHDFLATKDDVSGLERKAFKHLVALEQAKASSNRARFARRWKRFENACRKASEELEE